MSENIFFDKTLSKAEQYEMLLPQIEELFKNDTNLIANLANLMAVLKYSFNFFWVGVYFVENEEELVLGPFQGPLACTRIQKSRGVCGTAWEKAETIIVSDVEQFPGHIACSSLSKSEIVVPVFNKKGSVFMIIDVDSEHLSFFDEDDKNGLERISILITDLLLKH